MRKSVWAFRSVALCKSIGISWFSLEIYSKKSKKQWLFYVRLSQKASSWSLYLLNLNLLEETENVLTASEFGAVIFHATGISKSKNLSVCNTKPAQNCQSFIYPLARDAPSCLVHCKSARSKRIALFLCMLGRENKMADALRAAFTSVTETVFPTSRSIRNNPRRHMMNTGLRKLVCRLHGYD